MPAIDNSEEIIRNCAKRIELTKGYFSKIKIHLTENGIKILHNNIDLLDFDYVWLSSFWESRDIAYSIKLHLEHSLVNHTYVEKATSKISDQIIFSILKIVTPNMFYIDSDNIVDSIEEIEAVCGYPLIIKDIRGSRGKFSALIRNRTELIEKRKSLESHRKFLFQKYIDNEYEWGVLVCNGKVVSAEKSFAHKDEYRNNACNGAVEEFVDYDDIPENIKDIAIRASEGLKLNWSRADILVEKITGDAYLLEVNRFPGITSNSTEVVGAACYIDSLLQKIK